MSVDEAESEPPAKPKPKARPRRTDGKANSNNQKRSGTENEDAPTSKKPATSSNVTLKPAAASPVTLKPASAVAAKKPTTTANPASSSTPAAKSPRDFDEWLNSFDEGKGKFKNLYLKSLTEQFSDMSMLKACLEGLCNFQDPSKKVTGSGWAFGIIFPSVVSHMCLHLLGRRGSYLRALFRGF